MPDKYSSENEKYCRMHRATWVQTELFLTFPPPIIGSISLIPQNTDETAGRFRVWLSIPGSEGPVLIWDRKVEGGFPELKVLARYVSRSSSKCPGLSICLSETRVETAHP